MNAFKFLIAFLTILVVTGCKPVHAGPYIPYGEPVEAHRADLTPEEWEEKWWEAEKRAHQLWQQAERGWDYFLENERLKEQLSDYEGKAAVHPGWLAIMILMAPATMLWFMWPRKHYRY